MSSYLTFLDYLELRRRVERRLASSQMLLMHSVFFVIVIAALLVNGTYSYQPPDYRPQYLVTPLAGVIMALWSVGLLLHGLWTYRASGAWHATRGQVVEDEMRQRLENTDDYMAADPQDLFQLHALLEDDIRERSGSTFTLLTFTIINAVIWVVWAIGAQAQNSFPWQVIPFLALGIYVPLLALSAWRRGRGERRVRKTLEVSTLKVGKQAAKRKREPRVSIHSLLDDGETEALDDFDAYYASKRSQS